MEMARGSGAPGPSWKERVKGDPGGENSLPQGVDVGVAHDGERQVLDGKQRQPEEAAQGSDWRVYWGH